MKEEPTKNSGPEERGQPLKDKGRENDLQTFDNESASGKGKKGAEKGAWMGKGQQEPNGQGMKGKKDSKNKVQGLYFLTFAIVLYIIAYLFDSGNTVKALEASWAIFYGIIPTLIFVILFMIAAFYLASPKTIKKYVGKGSGIKGWFLAVSTGILSHGPIYIWFPMLKDLRAHGMRNGLMATFLYNRAIKLPFLPVMIYYFGWVFVSVLMFYMVVASIVQGTIFDILEKKV